MNYELQIITYYLLSILMSFDKCIYLCDNSSKVSSFLFSIYLS